MAPVDPSIVEMPLDVTSGAMPHYPHLLAWTAAEVAGLDDAQLDLHDRHPDREWMWWSIRRQVSHMAWDCLIFCHRRCPTLLWPDGAVPEPISWDDHRLGPAARFDRRLDPARFPTVDDLLGALGLGVSWLQRVVTEHPIEELRAATESIRGTHFWEYVITTLPRGAAADPERPGHIRYDLEGSLWMVFYENLAHIRTIQRLKAFQGLPPAVALPRVGYLRLPEYSGDTDLNGPSMERLPT